MLIPIGGTSTRMESGSSSHSSSFELFARGLTLPSPPNAMSSELKISLYFPANGTPILWSSYASAEKFTTQRSVSSSFSDLRRKTSMFSFAEMLLIHSKPSGL